MKEYSKNFSDFVNACTEVSSLIDSYTKLGKWSDKKKTEYVFGEIQKLWDDVKSLQKHTNRMKYNGQDDVADLLFEFEPKFGTVLNTWNIIKENPFEQSVESVLTAFKNEIPLDDLVKYRNRIERISLLEVTIADDNKMTNEGESRRSKTTKVFISYSHDSDEHKKWVLDLAIKLCENGIDVILDRWDLKLGCDVAKFMESSTDADRVLMICTEQYVKKADEGKGGAGYEAMIVTGELLRNLDTTKFIPVIRQKSGEIKLPKSVSTRAYINISDDRSFEKEFERLLRDLHQTPAISRPPIGPNPFIAESSAVYDKKDEQIKKRQGRVDPILFNENSPLLPVIRQKINKRCETLKHEKLTPWLWFDSRGVNITDFYGKTISLKGIVYGGGTEVLVFFSFIAPFLKDAIVNILDETLETCRARGLKPEGPYIRETAMLLDGHLIDPIYSYMAEIDRRIRGKGDPKSVKRRDVTDEITEMVKFLDKCKDEMIQGIKEIDLVSEQRETIEVEPNKKSTISFTDSNRGKMSMELTSLDSTNPVIEKKLEELIEKKLAFLHIPVYPFKAEYLRKTYLDKIAYNKAIEKFGTQTLMSDEEDLLNQVLGKDWYIDNLRIFLAQTCNIQNPENLSYKGIINAIRINYKVPVDNEEHQDMLQVKQKENQFEMLEKYKTPEEYLRSLDEFKQNPSNFKNRPPLTNPLLWFMYTVGGECHTIIHQLTIALDLIKKKKAGNQSIVIDDTVISPILQEIGQKISDLVKHIKQGYWGYDWQPLVEMRGILSNIHRLIFPKISRAPSDYVPEEFNLIEKELIDLSNILNQHIELRREFNERLKRRMPFEQAIEILNRNSLAVGGGTGEKEIIDKRGYKMEPMIPNFEWYSSVSSQNNIPPRCPYANVDVCPHYYATLSLLGSNGNATKLQPSEEKRLSQK